MARLEEYRRKRRFPLTPEPPGKEAPDRGNLYIVQKHRARRLHYDLRLAIDGVLKSWAVPKGPTLNPSEKRLAVQTEDHPLDYANFEGVIPEGNYGAGTVMVWDRGEFEVVGGQTASEQLARGELKFILRGKKLRGGFVLVKLRRSTKGNEWLLIKHKDAAADVNWKIEEHDGSVVSGRTLGEIAAGEPPQHLPGPADLEGAKKIPMPARVEPMLATSVEKPFSDPDWLFEVKWDGVRALAWIKDGKLALRSRAGRDITEQYPELGVLPECLRANQAIVDGEIVVLDASGRSDFEPLQARMNTSRPSPALQRQAPVTYYLFDLLYCDGYDLREAPVKERKQVLRSRLELRDPIRFSDHQLEQGKQLFELARQQGLEGIVGKHAHSPYVGRRSAYWVKFKVRQELDAVVGGWTAPRGAREYFGALLLGVFEGAKLQFIGHVGSGFTEKTQKAVYESLSRLATKRCPFATAPETNEQAWWARPQVVVRVEHSGWTGQSRLRHPVFLGLRTDIKPEDCQLDTEIDTRKQPVVVTAPAIAGRVLKKKAEIERELFEGREENVTIELDGKRMRLSNLNKMYFPESGYTKRALLAYYYRMANHVLPFLRQRPLVLRRYPDGITGQAFFQKDAGEAAPEWMEKVAIHSPERQADIWYFVANDRPALLYLTNLGCIDHNPWASRTDDLERPDYITFDLDPTEGTDYASIVEVARAVHEKLNTLALTAFLKTSGATGFHLYVPIERRYTHDQVRTFAEIVARLVAAEQPEQVTQDRQVAKRPLGKVYIDVFQNVLGRPLAAPYTIRAFPKAPVSAPLRPSELRRNLRPERFNIKTIFARVEKLSDPWAEFGKKPQTLDRATESLTDLLARSRKS